MKKSDFIFAAWIIGVLAELVGIVWLLVVMKKSGFILAAWTAGAAAALVCIGWLISVFRHEKRMRLWEKAFRAGRDCSGCQHSEDEL